MNLRLAQLGIVELLDFVGVVHESVRRARHQIAVLDKVHDTANNAVADLIKALAVTEALEQCVDLNRFWIESADRRHGTDSSVVPKQLHLRGSIIRCSSG